MAGQVEGLSNGGTERALGGGGDDAEEDGADDEEAVGCKETSLVQKETPRPLPEFTRQRFPKGELWFSGQLQEPAREKPLPYEMHRICKPD